MVPDAVPLKQLRTLIEEYELLEGMIMFQYSINLVWSDEDNGYVATIPEFPHLSAFGETPEIALLEAKTAAELMLEVLKEEKEEPPEPKKLIEYSGQTRLRLPKSLHRGLAIEAEREGVSLNTLLVSKLSEYLGTKKCANLCVSTTTTTGLYEISPGKRN